MWRASKKNIKLPCCQISREIFKDKVLRKLILFKFNLIILDINFLETLSLKFNAKVWCPFAVKVLRN